MKLKYSIFVACSILVATVLFSVPYKASASSDRIAVPVTYTVDQGYGITTSYTFFVAGKTAEVISLATNPWSAYAYYMWYKGQPNCGNFTITLTSQFNSCTWVNYCTDSVTLAKRDGSCNVSTSQCAYGCSNGACKTCSPTLSCSGDKVLNSCTGATIDCPYGCLNGACRTCPQSGCSSANNGSSTVSTSTGGTNNGGAGDSGGGSGSGGSSTGGNSGSGNNGGSNSGTVGSVPSIILSAHALPDGVEHIASSTASYSVAKYTDNEITWVTNDANYCSGSPANFFATLSGTSSTGRLTDSQNYTLTCSNDTGTTTKTVKILVPYMLEK